MTRPAVARIVLALALAGCGAPAGGPLVAEDAASAALLAGAAAAWGRPELAAAEADPAQATVRWGDCPLGGAEGGSAVLGCWDGTTIWLSPALLSDEMAPLGPRVAAHEVGHWLRGDGSHLAHAAQGGPCLDRERGPALMCPSAGPEVTDADREFVLGE